MSFSWSACLDEMPGNQSGKKAKTSHYSDNMSNLPNSSEGNTISSWDIDGGLAADFDGSLSGLGAELGSTAYNMNEALLALPVFKQENLDSGFQYILGAATSPAVKINEETLTYLNQGQSYEIKLKKLGDLSELDGQYLRSTVKVCFHERRLQYMEREQLELWMTTRPGERILDIDIPLSYGLIDVVIDPHRLNSVDFIWDPTKEVGIYVRVNCISTEFTAKKHGGEKGVPFRLQIETRESDEESSKIINCASCQIKVFKPKGADRKHKTDREKMEKRVGLEKDKFQPSYECTVLTEIPLEQILQTPPIRNGLTNVSSFGSLTQALKDQSISSSTPNPRNKPVDQWHWQQHPSGNGGSGDNNIQPMTPVRAMSEPSSPKSFVDMPSPVTVPSSLSPEVTSKEVTAWLKHNRFSQYINVFQNFAGADLLRLTRDDLIQICGLADGIRLNNALQSRNVRPRLSLYVCQEPGTVYHALYLESLTSHELVAKITDMFKLNSFNVSETYVQGPSAIHILLTDEVVRNISDQSRMWLEIKYDDSNPDQIKFLLKLID